MVNIIPYYHPSPFLKAIAMRCPCSAHCIKEAWRLLRGMGVGIGSSVADWSNPTVLTIPSPRVLKLKKSHVLCSIRKQNAKTDSPKTMLAKEFGCGDKIREEAPLPAGHRELPDNSAPANQ